MSVIWSDLQTQTQDYIRNYTTGGFPQGNLDRAINRAVEYFQRRLSLPSDRRIYRFYFTSDTLYYTLPAGFNEAIGLYYDVQSNNTPSNEWEFRPDTDILAFSGLGALSSTSVSGTSGRFWGFSTYNQVSPGQLILVGPNIHAPTVLDPLSSVGTWTALNDANTLAQDTNIYQVGPGSLSFTINPAGGAGYGIINNSASSVNYNFLTYSQNNGRLAFYVYFGGTVNFSSVQIILQSSVGNYWTGTMTANADGTAWTANQWNKLGIFWNSLVATGSPSATSITTVQFKFNEGAGFTTTTTMHINYWFITVPDYMDLVYYSAYKGHVANASTDILVFNYNNSTTNVADVLYFGDYAPDLIGPICKRAAIELMPQLRQDKDFYGEYKKEVNEWISILGKTYPRKRGTNFGQTKLRRTSLD